jgi:hypothetical protein
MTPHEKESILVVSKFLALCKGDSDKFSIMRNYLHNKITKLLESKRSNLSKSEFRTF